MDVASNNAYPTPFANNPILPLLLLSLTKQKNSPTPSTSFRKEYDFIIVGGGSAGSVLASRLSEVPCVSVLLLEAGKAPPLLTDVPGLARNFWFTDLDWTYKTVPQKHCGYGLVNNQVVWPSGKALGGSSILNAMLYVRGNRKNYDNWARQGAVGWSLSDLCPYFMKLENNTDAHYLKKGFHVVEGPVTVERPGYEPEIKRPIFEAAEEMGYEILDPNGAKQTGFYDLQATIRNGQRCSTAKAYLVPAENRTNLDILTNAFVRKVVVKRRRASGVRFDFGGKTHEVRARREVIMSAGTTNTAQLLMLSGIGPREHLEKFNVRIPVAADLPVGENFHDHSGVPLLFQLDPQIPNFLTKLADPASAQEYIQNKTGPLSSTEGVSVIAFLNGQPKHEEDFPNHEIYFGEIPKEVLQFQVGLKPEIPVAADLPVGENFHDHSGVPLLFQLDPQIPNFLTKLADPASAQEYIQNKTGPLSSTEGVSVIAFLNGQPKHEEDFPNHEIYFGEIPKEVLQFQVGLKPEIPVAADLPVGENFHDHSGVPLLFQLDPQIPNFMTKLADPASAQEYIQNKTGPLSSTEGVSVIAFLNGQPKHEEDFPNHEIYFGEIPKEVLQFQVGLKPEVYKQMFEPYENATMYACLVQILQPKSRGTVRLNSSDPYDPPLIDPNYYEDPRDIQDIVQGLKTCMKIAMSEPMQKIGSKPLTTLLPGCEQYANDEDRLLECVTRSVVMTLSHQVGTAKMGDPRDPTTVVDAQLRVKGIKGLRVADASIMPIVPSGNTNIPTIVVAEKASDMIKTTLNCYTQRAPPILPSY